MTAELEPAVDVDARMREVYLRWARGETQVALAEAYGVVHGTIQNWIDRAALAARSQHDDFEAERSRLIVQFEDAAEHSRKAFDQMAPTQKDRAAHMTNHLRALQMSARLRGMDAAGGGRAQGPAVHIRETDSEVVIKVGGETMVRRRLSKTEGPVHAQAVEVSAREIPSRRRGSAPAGVAAASERADHG